MLCHTLKGTLLPEKDSLAFSKKFSHLKYEGMSFNAGSFDFYMFYVGYVPELLIF
jgi:hypothetical protein